MTLLLVILGAGAGAPARYAVSRGLNHLRGFPWGTLTVNVVGSAVLGFVLAGVAGRPVTNLDTLVVSFCGGFTTYSAFALETVELGRLRGAVYAVTTTAVGLAAAAIGWWLG
jgi:CrcB protein